MISVSAAAASAPTAAMTASSASTTAWTPASTTTARPAAATTLIPAGTVSRLVRLAIKIRLVGKISAAFNRQRWRWLFLSFVGRNAAFAPTAAHLGALLFQNRLAR